MKIRHSIVIGFLIFVTATGLSLAGQAEEKSAVKAAEAWLVLIDGSKYTESWTEAAGLFKNAVTKDQWSGQVRAVREPLGRMLKRTVVSKQYTKTLPGAPDGEYVVIQFDTAFENKKNATETVTPMLDKGGKWRVSGYYIK